MRTWQDSLETTGYLTMTWDENSSCWIQKCARDCSQTSIKTLHCSRLVFMIISEQNLRPAQSLDWTWMNLEVTRQTRGRKVGECCQRSLSPRSGKSYVGTYNRQKFNSITKTLSAKKEVLYISRWPKVSSTSSLGWSCCGCKGTSGR